MKEKSPEIEMMLLHSRQKKKKKKKLIWPKYSWVWRVQKDSCHVDIVYSPWMLSAALSESLFLVPIPDLPN